MRLLVPAREWRDRCQRTACEGWIQNSCPGRSWICLWGFSGSGLALFSRRGGGGVLGEDAAEAWGRGGAGDLARGRGGGLWGRAGCLPGGGGGPRGLGRRVTPPG